MGEERQGELGGALRSANARVLRELVREHVLTLDVAAARQVLRNPHVTGEVIEELASSRRLLASYEVRRTIARHPRTIMTSALRFVPGLYWHDLMELGLDVRIKPRVRRAADKYLLLRMPQLSLGEKIALARRAGPAILDQLRRDPEERVITALLDNPRLTEETLMPVVADHRTRPQILDRIAASARWGSRYRLRVALSRNPQTPFRVQRAILPGLRRDDLAQVAAMPLHSSVVRRWARELLDDRHRKRMPESHLTLTFAADRVERGKNR